MQRTLIVVALAGALGCDSPSSGGMSGQAASSSTSAAGSSSTSTTASSAAAVHSPARVPDTIVVQHVLVGYKGAKRVPRTVARSRPEAKARAADALAKLRAGAEFEDVVREYSDDPGSVERQGLLGKIHRADLDPTFSAAAFALQVDEVSDVVETPFGFHIIKRTQ